MIDITGVDLPEFVKAVYQLSAPQGLGFLDYTPKPLSDEEAEQILKWGDDRIALRMDYVRGRACKITVYRRDDRLKINDNWYDHTDEQLVELLRRFNITVASHPMHSLSCNCEKCR